MTARHAPDTVALRLLNAAVHRLFDSFVHGSHAETMRALAALETINDRVRRKGCGWPPAMAKKGRAA